MRRRRGPGLVRLAATTAVVAGTAGGVRGREGQASGPLGPRVKVRPGLIRDRAVISGVLQDLTLWYGVLPGTYGRTVR